MHYVLNAHCCCVRKNEKNVRFFGSTKITIITNNLRTLILDRKVGFKGQIDKREKIVIHKHLWLFAIICDYL